MSGRNRTVETVPCLYYPHQSASDYRTVDMEMTTPELEPGRSSPLRPHSAPTYSGAAGRVGRDDAPDSEGTVVPRREVGHPTPYPRYPAPPLERAAEQRGGEEGPGHAPDGGDYRGRELTSHAPGHPVGAPPPTVRRQENYPPRSTWQHSGGQEEFDLLGPRSSTPYPQFPAAPYEGATEKRGKEEGPWCVLPVSNYPITSQIESGVHPHAAKDLVMPTRGRYSTSPPPPNWQPKRDSQGRVGHFFYPVCPPPYPQYSVPMTTGAMEPRVREDGTMGIPLGYDNTARRHIESGLTVQGPGHLVPPPTMASCPEPPLPSHCQYPTYNQPVNPATRSYPNGLPTKYTSESESTQSELEQTRVRHLPRRRRVPSKRIGTDRSHSRESVPKYNGKFEFAHFLIQFECMAEDHRWSYAQKGKKLNRCLVDEGRSVLGTLSGSEATDFDSLCKALDSLHNIPGGKALVQAQLQRITRPTGQSASAFGREIKRLGKKAYPQGNEEALVASYIRGLNDDELRKYVQLQMPSTLNGAIEYASIFQTVEGEFGGGARKPKFAAPVRTPEATKPEWESRMSELEAKMDSVLQKLDKPLPRMPLAQVECFACHEKGHYANNCPHRTGGRPGVRVVGESPTEPSRPGPSGPPTESGGAAAAFPETRNSLNY